MKRLNLLILLMLTASISFGQKYTINPIQDKIIDFALRQGMKDHILVESLQEQNHILNLSLSNKDELTTKLQEFNIYLQGRDKDLVLRWNEAMKQNDILKQNIQDQQEQFKQDLKKSNHRKNWGTVLGIGSGIALGAIFGAIFIK